MFVCIVNKVVDTRKKKCCCAFKFSIWTKVNLLVWLLTDDCVACQNAFKSNFFFVCLDEFEWLSALFLVFCRTKLVHLRILKVFCEGRLGFGLGALTNCECSVYSFSSSCPKTVSRTREVFPTGSTTLLRLQLSRTRDCAHRSRHVGLFLFFCLLERKVPAQSKLKE